MHFENLENHTQPLIKKKKKKMLINSVELIFHFLVFIQRTFIFTAWSYKCFGYEHLSDPSKAKLITTQKIFKRRMMIIILPRLKFNSPKAQLQTPKQ